MQRCLHFKFSHEKEKQQILERTVTCKSHHWHTFFSGFTLSVDLSNCSSIHAGQVYLFISRWTHLCVQRRVSDFVLYFLYTSGFNESGCSSLASLVNKVFSVRAERILFAYLSHYLDSVVHENPWEVAVWDSKTTEPQCLAPSVTPHSESHRSHISTYIQLQSGHPRFMWESSALVLDTLFYIIKTHIDHFY